MAIYKVATGQGNDNAPFRRSIVISLCLAALLLSSGFGSLAYAWTPPTDTPPTEGKGAPKQPEPALILRDALILRTAPRSWGAPKKGSSGEIRFNKESREVLLLKLTLGGLVPNHAYILSLNGKIWHESNNKLPQTYGKERYYDFAQIWTNAEGAVVKYLTVELSPGEYNVKFFVKDPDKDWRIVLYNDLFLFSIE